MKARDFKDAVFEPFAQWCGVRQPQAYRDRRRARQGRAHASHARVPEGPGLLTTGRQTARTNRLSYWARGGGGLVAAMALRKRSPKQHPITVVERERSFSLAAPVLWVTSGDRMPDQVSRPLARLEHKGIDLVRGKVQHIDAAAPEAMEDGKTRRADDVMIVALGAELVPSRFQDWPSRGSRSATCFWSWM